MAASDQGFLIVDLDAGRFAAIGDPEPDVPGNRFNDGKVDAQGRFWAGTMDDAELASSGALYRLNGDRSWQRIDDGYRIPNGPAFSPDGLTAYAADSARRIVYRYPATADNPAAYRETLIECQPDWGFPDGMATDTHGCLWIAFWDGWSVRRFDPDGRLVEQLPIPVQRPTSCCFGGVDLDQLFITSARTGLSPAALADQPFAGALFSLTPGVRGVAAPDYIG